MKKTIDLLWHRYGRALRIIAIVIAAALIALSSLPTIFERGFGYSAEEAREAGESVRKSVSWWSGRIAIFALTYYVVRTIASQITEAPAQMQKPKVRRSWKLLRRWTWSALLESALVAATVFVTWMILVRSAPELGTSIYDVVQDFSRSVEVQTQSDPAQPAGEPSMILVWVIRTAFFALFVLFYLSIVPIVPRAAFREELLFRKGVKTWRQAIGWNLLFGFVHPLFLPILPVLIGIPLACAGMWLTLHYWKGGVRRSALYHALYNLCILPMIIIVYTISVWW